jgi:RNA polymerase-binding transcription factor DksA
MYEDAKLVITSTRDNLGFENICHIGDYLVGECAKKNRSKTLTEISQSFCCQTGYNEPARYVIAKDALTLIADLCLEQGVPLLSTLAVSNLTRKPGEWFEIWVFNNQRELANSSIRTPAKAWQNFVDAEQRLAVNYWEKRCSFSEWLREQFSSDEISYLEASHQQKLNGYVADNDNIYEWTSVYKPSFRKTSDDRREASSPTTLLALPDNSITEANRNSFLRREAGYCLECDRQVPERRRVLGYDICISCAEQAERCSA